MANQLYIPKLNPVQFYWVSRPFPFGKNRYFIDEDWFSAQIPEYYQKIQYLQKWQTSDTIRLQIKANFGPISWQVIDCTGQLLKSGDFSIVTTNVVGQPYIYYQMELQCADPDLKKGQIYLIINAGFGETVMQWISEPMELGTRFPNTMLYTYKHSHNVLDVVFDTGIEFQFRCESNLPPNLYTPGVTAKSYNDQNMNSVLISATPFDQFTLSIGGSYGVPGWVIKKINFIFCCDYTDVEGLKLTKPEDSSWEVNKIDLYAMCGWKTEVRPAINKFSDSADETFNQQVTVVFNIDANVFGTFNDLPENNNIQIIDTIE